MNPPRKQVLAQKKRKDAEEKSISRKESIMWLKKLHTYGQLIKFSHTVFALPFALAAVVLAGREHPIGFYKLFFILMAMAGARSAAMGFNRYVDYKFDRLNPRTTDRPIVSGKIDRNSVLFFTGASSAVFILAAAMLGKLCFQLSIPVLLTLFVYSYTKRFTSLSHLFLGFAIGLAPLGAWIAATGIWDHRVLWLSLALMTYIAGFDILYACQDVDFDRGTGLHSIPANWGVEKAFRISERLHIATFFSLLAVYFAFGLSTIYLAFLAAITLLLVIEHRLVKPHDLGKIDLAFFHANSAVSILLFLAVWMDTAFS